VDAHSKQTIYTPVAQAVTVVAAVETKETGAKKEKAPKKK
jgi:hypothetical protein